MSPPVHSLLGGCHLTHDTYPVPWHQHLHCKSCRTLHNCPILHSLQVLTCFFFLIYIIILLLLQVHLPSATLSPLLPPCSKSFSFHLSYYQPIPYPSVCTSLNRLQYILICSKSLVLNGLNCFPINDYRMTSNHPHSSRHAHFLFTLLLILAGDINLNPGPAPVQSLNFSHLNIRSASSITPDINKPAVLQDFILSHNIDFLALSETWLSSDSPPSILNSLSPANFSLLHTPRSHGMGGGVAFIYKSEFSVSQISLPVFSSFESICIRLTLVASSFTILAIYRPPSSSKCSFISDFSTLLEDLVIAPSELLITGDFNFHLDPPVPTSDVHFLTLLDTFSLTQHITFPTHTSSHILDLLITRSSSNFISSVTFTDPGLSDHLAILATLSVPAYMRPPRITKTTRSFRTINCVAFSQDIQEG